MNTRGIFMFGINNANVNYVRICLLNAALVKKHLGTDVSVAVAMFDEDWSSLTDEEQVQFEQVVNHRISIPKDLNQVEVDQSMSMRVYRNTQYYETVDRFNNQLRYGAYTMSPFDETILLDCDYLIQSDSLNACWGSDHDIMINRQAARLDGTLLKGPEWRLNNFGVRMYWATCVYFKKTELAQHLFNMVEHIRSHWGFYRQVYGIEQSLFRNDHAFSIAIHKLNGMVDGDNGYSIVTSLPVDCITTSTDRDRVEYVPNVGLIVMFNDPTENWNFYPVNTTGVDVHIMNKIGLMPTISLFINEVML